MYIKRVFVSVLILCICLMAVFAFKLPKEKLPKEKVVAYTPRLTEPASTNKYFFSELNIFYAYGYGMPNCTAYAYGRAYEILNKKPELSHGNAGQWYNYNKITNAYSYGQTPKVGAIACWDNYDSNTGHVAVVEKITDTSVIISESAWQSEMFFTGVIDLQSFQKVYSNMRFLGYIYIVNFDCVAKE